MDKNDVEIQACDTVFQGYFRVDKYRLRHKLFGGGWSQTFEREVFERGYSAAVLLVDPDKDQLVFVRQFRTGALADAKTPWLIELVAGAFDKPGETPEALLRREVQEEAGITVTDLQPLYEFWISPGGCSEKLYLYCGRVDASQAQGVHGNKEEDEDIEVVVMDREKALSDLAAGKFNNAPIIMALQWLQQNYQQLKQGWQHG